MFESAPLLQIDTRGWVATPEESEALRVNHLNRLKVQLERVIQAFETAPIPEDHGGIGRAARALITLAKAAKDIHAAEAKDKAKTPKPQRTPQRDDEMNDDTADQSLDDYRTKAIAADPRCAQWADWQFKLERELADLARRRGSARTDQPDDGGTPPA